MGLPGFDSPAGSPLAKEDRMSKQIERSWMDADRYLFDCGECAPGKGFAQVDTGQDAWYFGTWANPFTFTIVCYCEGDITRTVCSDAESFNAEMLEIQRWNEEHGHGFKGVDAMLKDDIADAFCGLGLSALLH
jgi:hypothetical protein